MPIQTDIEQSATQKAANQDTGFTTSATQIMYRTISQGNPLTHSNVDANFEILRSAVNGIISDISGVAGNTINVDVPTGAVFTDTVYTLPVATASVLGGVKIGSGVAVNSSGIISAPTFAYNSTTKTLTITNA